MTTTTILSDNGASSGSAGLKTTGGNDGTLVLQTTTTGGTATAAVTIDTSQNATFNSTGALTVPSGTTAQRPGSPVVGQIRYNTTTGQLDAYTASGWSSFGAYPDQTYVTPVNLAYQNMGTAGYYNLGSISIPSSGDWRIYTHLRWGSGNYQGYVWITPSTSAGSGGVFGYPKMQIERIGTVSGTGNLNVGLQSEFIIRFGTGCTFPYTFYILAYESSTGVGSLFLQNDSNGYNQLGATKLSSTSSSASTPVQIGY